ncbi:hypothetical protein [Lichenicoccus sp.]|uniref:hypothetical protein n=1 Tax=Lichenicoccus sp. TaxID=2781899 RepID=UPI003D117C3C
MKFIPIAFGAALLATTAMAQTTNTPNPGHSPAMTSHSPMAGMNPNTVSKPGNTMMSRTSGTAAASGSDNQAVTTTNANAPQPASGANSFSRGQARGRIEGEGYSKVSSLHKDHNGVWRGRGTKNGQSMKVWLDYKGNVGSST